LIRGRAAATLSPSVLALGWTAIVVLGIAPGAGAPSPHDAPAGAPPPTHASPDGAEVEPDGTPTTRPGTSGAQTPGTTEPSHDVAPAEPARPPSKRARAQAARAVKRGKAAAGAGDYASAIAAFEEAARLDPSPAISFNLGVCHHASMLAAPEGDPARAAHRDAAIASYRAYLDAQPDASDRADVERIIAELAPPPVAVAPDEPPPVLGPPPELRDAVTRIEPTIPEAQTPEPSPPVASEPSTRAPAFFGPFLPVVLAHAGRLADTDLVERMPMVGLGLRGGALVGPRDRLAIGGELAVYGQPSDGVPRHRLLDGHVSATLDFKTSIGERRRLLLGGGGTLGLLFEALHTGGTTTLVCPTTRDGKVSSRAGLLVGGRFVLGVLLGRRRNHELALRVTPALALMGNGNSGDLGDDAPAGSSCGPSPFSQAGLPGGAALVTMIDLGYSPRF
jgi:tetratricopeptide (TPR) repeat protein